MEDVGVKIIISTKVDSSVAKWIDSSSVRGFKSNIASRALEFYYDYNFNKKGFFIRLIEIHFQDIKHLLRKIGRIKEKNG